MKEIEEEKREKKERKERIFNFAQNIIKIHFEIHDKAILAICFLAIPLFANRIWYSDSPCMERLVIILFTLVGGLYMWYLKMSVDAGFAIVAKGKKRGGEEEKLKNLALLQKIIWYFFALATLIAVLVLLFVEA